MREYVKWLFGIPGVVAVGRGQKGIVVSVERKLPESRLRPEHVIPKYIEGVPTSVVETGKLWALRTSRHRPAPGGVSIGHVDITAGTLGCLVEKDGQAYILSNNHVLANSNDAELGDAILQPGPHDGGTMDDRIAELYDFVPVQFALDVDCPVSGAVTRGLNAVARVLGSRVRFLAARVSEDTNLVDAAIAKPMRDEDVTAEVLEIGQLTGSASGELGMGIAKSGRTTGLTAGEITQVDVTCQVQYGLGQIAIFEDQLMAGPMSEGGDSGSVVVNGSNQVVGLLFAGSAQVTIMNRIEHVLEAFGVLIG